MKSACIITAHGADQSPGCLNQCSSLDYTASDGLVGIEPWWEVCLQPQCVFSVWSCSCAAAGRSGIPLCPALPSDVCNGSRRCSNKSCRAGCSDATATSVMHTVSVARPSSTVLTQRRSRLGILSSCNCGASYREIPHVSNLMAAVFPELCTSSTCMQEQLRARWFFSRMDVLWLRRS